MKNSKENWLKFVAIAGVCLCVAGLVEVWGALTKSDSDAAAPGATSEVLFASTDAKLVVKSIFAKSGTAGDTLVLYARDADDTLNPYTISEATAAGTHVPIGNSGTYPNMVTNGDHVVLQWADGTVQHTMCNGRTATSATITATSSKALAVTTKLYKMEAAGTITIGSTAWNESGPALYATPSDSPLYILATGTNANTLVVTAE